MRIPYKNEFDAWRKELSLTQMMNYFYPEDESKRTDSFGFSREINEDLLRELES